MQAPDPRELLEKSIYEALKTYSNVHRGSGHKSMASTALFEQARSVILDYLGLEALKYQVIFCSPYQASILEEKLLHGTYQILSSAAFGLATGVRALAVRKGALPKGPPPFSGGGTTKLMSTGWVIWDKAPARFEAGTPPIMNIIVFARVLQLTRKYGEGLFKDQGDQKPAVNKLLYQDQLDGHEGKDLLHRIRNTRIGLDLKVPTSQGPLPYINFDSSASTPTFAPVWDTFRNTLFADPGKDSTILKAVRKICADFLGAPSGEYEVIFTCNATEAINLVAGSLARTKSRDHHPVILGTLMEHSSNDLPWRSVPGHSLIRIPVDREGFVDAKELSGTLEDYNRKGRHGDQRIRLVAVSAASNVLGTCNNLEEISEIVHRYDAELLVDGAQLVAHRKVEVTKMALDYFVFSAHKVYAPFGCGVLVVRKGLLHYAAEDRARILASGEENLAGTAALGKALQLLDRIGMELVEKEEQELTALVLRGMKEIPGMKLVGIRDHGNAKVAQRVGVIPFNLGNMVSFSVGKQLASRYGVGVRVGCHCAHILVKHVLGVGPGLEKFQRIIQTLIPAMSFPGVVRVSLGLENTSEDIDSLLAGLNQLSNKNKDRAPAPSSKETKRMFSEYIAESKAGVFGSLE